MATHHDKTFYSQLASNRFPEPHRDRYTNGLRAKFKIDFSASASVFPIVELLSARGPLLDGVGGVGVWRMRVTSEITFVCSSFSCWIFGPSTNRFIKLLTTLAMSIQTAAHTRACSFVPRRNLDAHKRRRCILSESLWHFRENYNLEHAIELIRRRRNSFSTSFAPPPSSRPFRRWL